MKRKPGSEVLQSDGREVTITNDILHHNVDYTPYEGQRVKGWPVLTLSRGEVVCRDGEVVAAVGRGSFLRCDLPAAAQTRMPSALPLSDERQCSSRSSTRESASIF